MSLKHMPNLAHWVLIRDEQILPQIAAMQRVSVKRVEVCAELGWDALACCDCAYDVLNNNSRRIHGATVVALSHRCTSNASCQLNGVCQSDGTCICDGQWSGPNCSTLNLGASTAAYTGMAPQTSTWGGHPVLDASTGIWHGYGACDGSF